MDYRSSLVRSTTNPLYELVGKKTEIHPPQSTSREPLKTIYGRYQSINSVLFIRNLIVGYRSVVPTTSSHATKTTAVSKLKAFFEPKKAISPRPTTATAPDVQQKAAFSRFGLKKPVVSTVSSNV